MKLEPGTLFANRYRVARELGSGGMGVVYAARDELLHRDVALKVLKDEQHAESAERFLIEARAGAQLTHQNIVTVFDLGVVESARFLVLELLEGRTLKQALEADGAFPWRRALALVAEAADALVVAHARGVVHRDLKPENLFLTSEPERIKVLDFGVARIATQDTNITQSGSFVGTPLYQAPEIALEGRRADPRSDLYSLGVVLYEMLTGRPPFTGQTAAAVVIAHAQQAPPPPAISPDVDALVCALLEKDPARRPSSADIVAKQCRTIIAAAADVDSRPASFSPTPPTGPVLHRPEPAVPAPARGARRPLLVVVALIALAVGVFGVVRALRDNGDARGAAPTAPIVIDVPRGLQAVDLRSDGMLAYAEVQTPGILVRKVERTGVVGDARRLPLSSLTDDLAFAPDGALWAATRDGVFRVDVDSAAATRMSAAAARSLAIARDGRVAISDGATIKIVTPDGATIHDAPIANMEVLSWSPAGDRLLLGHVFLEPSIAIVSADLRDLLTIARRMGMQNRSAGSAAMFLDDDTVLFAESESAAPGSGLYTLTARRADRTISEPRRVPDHANGGLIFRLGSPVGSGAATVVVAATKHRQLDIYRGELAADARAVTSFQRVTFDVAEDRFADFIDDDTVQFASNRRGGWDLFRQRFDALDAELFLDDESWVVSACSARDGALVYLSVPPPQQPTQHATLVLRRPGKPLQTLTTTTLPASYTGFGRPPPWYVGTGGDGARCFYWHNNVAGILFDEVDVERATLQRVTVATVAAATETQTKLTIRGDTIAFAGGGHADIDVRTLGSGRAHPMPVGAGCTVDTAALLPDGAAIAARWCDNDTRSELVHVSLDGVISVLRAGDAWISEVAIAPSARRIVATVMTQADRIVISAPPM